MLAWHYTTGDKFELIQQSGVLLPADIGIEPPELPIIWFSTASYYENSAKKGLLDEEMGRAYRQATVEEMYEIAGGLYRLGCPISQLLTGERLRKASKMTLSQWKRLLKSAQHMKASASDWWGLPGETLPISDLVIEQMSPSMKWRPFALTSAALPG